MQDIDNEKLKKCIILEKQKLEELYPTLFKDAGQVHAAIWGDMIKPEDNCFPPNMNNFT